MSSSNRKPSKRPYQNIPGQLRQLNPEDEDPLASTPPAHDDGGALVETNPCSNREPNEMSIDVAIGTYKVKLWLPFSFACGI